MSCQKVLQMSSFFKFFFVKSRSRYSLARILSTSSPKSGLRPSVFLRSYVVNCLMMMMMMMMMVMMWLTFEIELSLLLCILSTSSSKSGLKPSIFVYVFYVKSSSRYSLVHISSTSSSKSGLRPLIFCKF